jgi:hypothetical protein
MAFARRNRFREAAMSTENRKNSKLYMPQESYFYEKVIPGLLIALGIVTAALIVFALGVLFGIVHF